METSRENYMNMGVSEYVEDESFYDNARTNSKLFDNGKGIKWSEEEDDLLRDVVEKYGAKNWKKICRFIPGRTSTQ